MKFTFTDNTALHFYTLDYSLANIPLGILDQIKHTHTNTHIYIS